MVLFENAKVLDPQEIKEICEEECSNPTVERLMFIECKAANKEFKIFPCYVAAWHEEQIKPPQVKSPIIFLIFIAQAMHDGNFGLVQVQVSEYELGATKRIWDKPPTKGRREDTPWPVIEAEVQ